MLQLVIALSAAVAALMVAVKTVVNTANPNAATDTRLPIIYLVLSLFFGVAGGMVALANAPALFANDPTFAAIPTLGAITAGLISVLPGGVSTSLLSLLALKLSGTPTVQAVDGKPRAFALWQ